MPTIVRRAPGAIGADVEERVLLHLLQHHLVLVRRNYRVARGPSRRGGEIDLVMRDRDGTLVFVEVRSRRDARHGGAAESIDRRKRARIVYAAQCFLREMPVVPPCRFDVVAVDGDHVEWLKAAFDTA